MNQSRTFPAYISQNEFIDKEITKTGYAVVTVTTDKSYAYTIGRVSQGLPELFVYCAPEAAQAIVREYMKGSDTYDRVLGKNSISYASNTFTAKVGGEITRMRIRASNVSAKDSEQILAKAFALAKRLSHSKVLFTQLELADTSNLFENEKGYTGEPQKIYPS